MYRMPYATEFGAGVSLPVSNIERPSVSVRTIYSYPKKGLSKNMPHYSKLHKRQDGTDLSRNVLRINLYFNCIEVL